MKHDGPISAKKLASGSLLELGRELARLRAEVWHGLAARGAQKLLPFAEAIAFMRWVKPPESRGRKQQCGSFWVEVASDTGSRCNSCVIFTEG